MTPKATWLQQPVVAKGLWALAVLLLVPATLTLRPGFGLDDSWRIGLNYAIRDGLVFGRDYIFTYGPLGYLLTGQHLFVPDWPFWLFTAAYVGSWALLLRAVMGSLPDNWSRILVVALAALVAKPMARDISLIPLLFVCFLLIAHHQNPKRRWLLVWAGVWSVAMLFMKANTGFFGLAFWLGYLAFAALAGTVRWPVVAWCVATALAGILLLGYAWQVFWPGYIAYSLEIIRGYGDAMSLFPTHPATQWYTIGFMLVWVGALLWCWLRWVSNKQGWLKVYLSACLMWTGFVAFKQGYVRADGEHLGIFFSFLPWLVLVGTRLMAGLWPAQWLWRLSLVAGMVALAGLQPDWIWSIVPHRPLSDATRHKTDGPNPRYVLPQRISSQIGRATVDVYPQDIGLAYWHGLHYRGRPVQQSYAAFTPVLDSINAAFLQDSLRAPAFILYQHESIDTRDPMFDEPQTRRRLMQHYLPVDTFNMAKVSTWEGHWLLLKRRSKPLTWQRRQLLDTTMQVGDTLTLPQVDGWLLASFEVSGTWVQKAMSAAYQGGRPTLLRISSDGSTVRHPILPRMASSGFFVNRIIPDTRAMAPYWSLQPAAPQAVVTGMGLLAPPRFFRQSYRLRLEAWTLKTDE